MFLILGIVLIVVGFLGLLHLIALGLTPSLIVLVVGVLLAVFGDRIPLRR